MFVGGRASCGAFVCVRATWLGRWLTCVEQDRTGSTLRGLEAARFGRLPVQIVGAHW